MVAIEKTSGKGLERRTLVRAGVFINPDGAFVPDDQIIAPGCSVADDHAGGARIAEPAYIVEQRRHVKTARHP